MNVGGYSLVFDSVVDVFRMGVYAGFIFVRFLLVNVEFCVVGVFVIVFVIWLYGIVRILLGV